MQNNQSVNHSLLQVLNVTRNFGSETDTSFHRTYLFYLILTYFDVLFDFYIYLILICDEYEGGALRAKPSATPDYWDYKATEKYDYGGKMTTLLNFMYTYIK